MILPSEVMTSAESILGVPVFVWSLGCLQNLVANGEALAGEYREDLEIDGLTTKDRSEMSKKMRTS